MVRVNLSSAVFIAAALIAVAAVLSPANAATKSTLAVEYATLPLTFEVNQGQTDERVRFLSRGRGYSLFLSESEAVLSLRGADGKGRVVRVKLLGAKADPKMTGLDRLPGHSNYFIGRDRGKWRTNIPRYAKVGYDGVYPGIDLVFYGTGRGQLEYDFIVAPGADPGDIELAIEGAESLEIGANGDLIAHLPGGEIRFLEPVIYQREGGAKRPVDGGFVLKDARVGFEVGPYDAGRPLIIDPVLIYSTYLGGGDWDETWGIAVDGAGDVYVTGATGSVDFPVTPGAFDVDCGTYGYCDPDPDYGYSRADVFVAKLRFDDADPPVLELVYATYLGGGDVDDTFSFGGGIAVLPNCPDNCDAYITGTTRSDDFPITDGAYQEDYQPDLDRPFSNAFVTRLNSTGDDLVFSTYLGGSGQDEAHGIALDADGNAHVTGRTYSDDFPLEMSSRGSLGGAPDAFVTKFNAAGSGLVYSTFLGGSGFDVGHGIAVDSLGNAFVAGSTNSDNFPTTAGGFDGDCGADGDNVCDFDAKSSSQPATDAFVTKFDAAGAMVYSSYLGGSDWDAGFGVAVDGAGAAYLIGWTNSRDFPSTMNAFQEAAGGKCGRKICTTAFVTKFDADGGDLIYSTYLGGKGGEYGYGISVDGAGNAFVTGMTASSGFPTRNAFQSDSGGGWDAFVATLNPAGEDLVFSTYLGGGGDDVGQGIAVDGAGNIYVAGDTRSTDFPTAPVAFDTSYNGGDDAFVVKISEASSPGPPEDPESGGGKGKPCNPRKEDCS